MKLFLIALVIVTAIAGKSVSGPDFQFATTKTPPHVADRLAKAKEWFRSLKPESSDVLKGSAVDFEKVEGLL